MVGCYTLDENGSYIYFIVSQDGFVKIGITNNYPQMRVETLQSGNPHELSLKLLIKGPREIEKLMHKLMAKYHHRGEWFRLEGVLEQFLTYSSNISLIIDELYFVKVRQWVF